MAAAHGHSLTDHEIAEILARLPPRCIARSRAVCRAWNAIASHPSVERVLAERPAAVTAVMKYATRWIEDDEDPHEPVDDVRVDRFRGRWHPDVHSTDSSLRAFSLDGMTISAEDFRSWDGVLCTRVFPLNPEPDAVTYYVLWNPLTKACAVVSGPAAQGRLIGGYAHPATGRFHLLHSSDVAVPGSGGRGRLRRPRPGVPDHLPGPRGR
ncbi:uncharacterized protein LOC120652235 [Panicum virgatum]|uniref:F-box domain-containing protein n=1 Tax=Panicum virgatum TaxID=38727 RepID=A0A8T0NSX9_PANVG|nr:uncharacterized protein LOC120652235 [Panicum virgatum]KAG2551655.1 hypothetical protein PVAP13_9KG410000 [Panicum virgatum]